MKFLYHLTPGILTSWILVLIMLNSCSTQMFIANCMFASNEQVTIAESSHARTREALFLAWMGTLALCRVWALVNKTNSLTWFKQRSSKTLSYRTYTSTRDANSDVFGVFIALQHDFKHG